VKRSQERKLPNVPTEDPGLAGQGFLKKQGPTIGLVALFLYVVLLGIGVIAEVFKIQWILDWWIWSPPGKFK
jgi:hypothetical protein